jgi:hypothetical protein
MLARLFGSVDKPDPAPHQVAEWQQTALRQCDVRWIVLGCDRLRSGR